MLLGEDSQVTPTPVGSEAPRFAAIANPDRLKFLRLVDPFRVSKVGVRRRFLFFVPRPGFAYY